MMNKRQRTLWLGILCFLGVAISHKMICAAASEVKETSWQEQFEQGSALYQNKESGKARVAFKEALHAL